MSRPARASRPAPREPIGAGVTGAGLAGAELMREAALLGAACVVTTPPDEVPAAAEGWSARTADRAELGERLRAHEASDDPHRVRLRDELGLDRASYWLVMLCAAVELHPEAAAAVSLLAEDPRVLVPTPTVVALLLRGILDEPFGDALAASIEGGSAGRLGLVEVLEPAPGLPHSHQALRLRQRELTALLTDPATVGRHRELDVAVVEPAPAPAFDLGLVQRAAALLDRQRILVVRGTRRTGRQLAYDVASLLGTPLHLVAVAGDPPPPSEVARLRDGLLALDLHPRGPSAPIPPSLRDAVLGPVLLLVDDTVEAHGLASVDAAAIGYPEARRIWAQVVDGESAADLAARYRVSAEEARTAVRQAADLVAPAPATGDGTADGTAGDDARDAHAARDARPATPDPETVASRVRAEGARRMGPHVSVVETAARLRDLVVPPELRAQLEEIVAWQRGNWRVLWEMDLARRDSAGVGLTCLFAGKPGTGKTFAAHCLAGELGLNLYRIDLSQIVSKYIGETEKALATVFDEVEAGHGILLFDEADAIFGRRSDVKDAHDRYANIEVGYLLQRLETYEGTAILTTNLQGNMDAAFVRRLRFVLQFPEPDRELRRELWERSVPGHPWRDDDLDLSVLADRFPLNGGAIRNIGLAAAHLAAATDAGRVTAGHVLRATQRELQKTGRPAGADAFDSLAGEGDLAGRAERAGRAGANGRSRSR